MKIIIVTSILFFFAGCSANRSDQIARLKDQRKILKDSIKYYRGWELYFNGKAVTLARSTHDSLQYKPIMDSQFKYSNMALNCENILKDVNGSIDSLSKMK